MPTMAEWETALMRDGMRATVVPHPVYDGVVSRPYCFGCVVTEAPVYLLSLRCADSTGGATLVLCRRCLGNLAATLVEMMDGPAPD